MGSPRTLAILSNVLFIAYGLELRLYPVLLCMRRFCQSTAQDAAIVAEIGHASLSAWRTAANQATPGVAG